MKVVSEGLQEVFAAMSEREEKVLIHCSAGMHRTGTVAYTLLRMSGRDTEQAREAIKLMREITRADVGEWRLELAETLYVPVVTP